MRVLAILTVRNEGAFLLDWLAHHRAAGVTDFLVFSNDCQDGTDRLLDRLAALGEVVHEPNPGPYGRAGVQFSALKRADRHPLVKAADWLLPLDIDEFVNVHVGDHTLPALLAALPDATAITLTWRLFGNCNVVHYRDEPVPRQFLHAAPRVLFWPWRAAMFKTLLRNDGSYRNLGVHRPRNLKPGRQPRWFDGSGRPLRAEFHTSRVFSDFGQDNYGLVQLNHYPLGAMESFVLKADRGRAVHAGDRLGLDYWVERNFCLEGDETILELAPAADIERARLGADREVARLHEEAVAWRRARFEALMAEEPFRALFGRLLMTPPSRPLTLSEARMLFSHARAAGRSESG